MTKSIFINAETREVVSVDLQNQLRETYTMIGCDLVQTALYLEGNDALVVDEEGLFKDGKCGFIIEDTFVYGNGMIWGCDDEGESADCKTDLSYVLSKIIWVDREKANRMRDLLLNSSPMVFFG